MSVGSGVIALPMRRCDGAIGNMLLSLAFSEVKLLGLMLLAASQSAKFIYISVSVSIFVLSVLYNAFCTTWTILSTSPLCLGYRSVL